MDGGGRWLGDVSDGDERGGGLWDLLVAVDERGPLYPLLWGIRTHECEYAACDRPADVCMFRMSDKRNAHIADCSNQSAPMENRFDKRLCCKVREVCTDGVDNDGDGLVDCADPECNGYDVQGDSQPGNDNLDPVGEDTPQACRPSSCPATLHEGLQAFYQFENNTLDSSGEDRHGAANGGPSYVNGVRSERATALELDGSSDYVNASGEAWGSEFDNVGRSDAFTVAFWINLNERLAYRSAVSGKSSDDVYNYSQPAITVQPHRTNTAGVTLVVNPGENSSRLHESGTTIPTDDWAHIAATHDGSRARIYVDGEKVEDNASDVNIVKPDKLTIGAYHPDAATINATIDQVRIHDRALSDKEIASFVNSSCNNRQRTVECINSPELCDTEYTGLGKSKEYVCNYGQFDRPDENRTHPSAPADKKGTGVCCPPDQDARWDGTAWTCTESNQCGVDGGDACEYNISSSDDAWFNSTSDGSSNACNSQLPNLHVDTDEQPGPEKRSQACCYVSKDGLEGYWYKDGNVEVYG